MYKTLTVAILVVFSMTFSACVTTAENVKPSPEPQADQKAIPAETAQHNPITPPKPLSGPQEITAEVAGKYAIYAMMASNSYHKSKRVRFPVEKAGWIQVDMNGNETTTPTKKHRFSGLAYDKFQKRGTNEVVFAIRGTDSRLRDYGLANFSFPPLSRQYSQINKEIGGYLKTHPDEKITVTGHSLGGGLALSVSVHHGVDAITFDPSPRIFDGRHNIHLPAKRVAIYESGEILEKFRKLSRKFFKVVPNEDIYKCSFDFGGVSKHRGDYLARELLNLGATVNGELIAIRDALPKKP